MRPINAHSAFNKVICSFVFCLCPRLIEGDDCMRKLSVDYDKLGPLTRSIDVGVGHCSYKAKHPDSHRTRKRKLLGAEESV